VPTATTLRAVSGLVGRSGKVEVLGRDVIRSSAESIARLGLAHVPEGRGTFTSLTVEENLWAGGVTRRRSEVQRDVERWYEFFPRLGERKDQVAGTLSGGEQQMLAIARAMMLSPQLLLLDEPSMGLAPNITRMVFDALKTINLELGVSMLIVEQNALLATSIAHSVYLLESGRVTFAGPASELENFDAIKQAYLGTTEDRS
jgi:branched-chain amino acid transport system ATP-binding protein